MLFRKKQGVNGRWAQRGEGLADSALSGPPSQAGEETGSDVTSLPTR